MHVSRCCINPSTHQPNPTYILVVGGKTQNEGKKFVHVKPLSCHFSPCFPIVHFGRNLLLAEFTFLTRFLKKIDKRDKLPSKPLHYILSPADSVCTGGVGLCINLLCVYLVGILSNRLT